MASLDQLLPSIFLLSTLVSIFIIDGISATPSEYSPCPSFSCGDGLKLGYPFWQPSQQTDHYGYPGLSISCINKTSTIQLHNHLYRIKKLNNSDNTLVVSFPELIDTICPVAPHDVVIISNISSYLNYTGDVKMLHFFYNCTVYPSGVEYIKCLQIGARHAYVFMEGSVPEFDWKGHCESIATVPVMEKSIDHGSLATSYGKVLQEGFELKWEPDLECRSCESSGGYCKYSRGLQPIFSCSCSDGQHRASCHDQGLLKRRFKADLFSIGLLSSGGLILVIIIFYIVGRKKSSSIYKQGFNPIPGSGK